MSTPTTTTTSTTTSETPRAAARTAKPSTLRAALLVAEREIGSKLRSRSFVISSVILLLFALAGVVWAGFALSNTDDTPVATTSETAPVVEALPGYTPETVADADAAIALVQEGEVDAALVPTTSGDAPYEIVALDSAPQGLLLALSQTPPVELLEPGSDAGALAFIVSFAFAIIFFFAASTFGGTIASSVVEEKQTRVVELLVAAVPVRAMLAGKVLGNTVLAMGQIVALVAIGIIGLAVTGQADVLGLVGAPLAWFAVFFLFGFLLLAALFAAAGAMVSRLEDIGSTMTPLTMLVLAPYILVIVFNDNPVVMAILSYVPFSAPIAMPVRLFLGTAMWWEPLLSLAVLIVGTAIAIALGARIYQNALLRMGGRVKLSEALKG